VKLVAAALLGLATAGCRTEGIWHEPESSLERMLEQPRYDAYESGAFFPDGKVLQRPPRGTRPYDPSPLDEAVATGVRDGAFVDRIPVTVSRSLAVRGRRHYDSFCGACHGVLGDGRTVVARHMGRPPRSLHEPRVQGLSDGQLFSVVSSGYGFMPGYAAELEPVERWAVVLYVRALQRSQNAELDAMPPALAHRAQELLP